MTNNSIKETKKINGITYVSKAWPNNPGRLHRLGEGLVGLIEKVLLEVHEYPAIKIEVRKVGDSYEYDIDYGDVPLLMEQVAMFQETARKALDAYRENDPSREKATLTTRYTTRRFDLFGFRRLTKLLLYGGQR